jgi:methionyl aminopeptidase
MARGQVYYKTEEEIDLIRQSSLLVGKTLAEVSKHIAPGVSTLDIDKIAYEFIKDHNAEPAFLDYEGFPNSLCTSVNAQVVHGIPTDKPLESGDIVSVDCGVYMNGFYGDSAYTFGVGDVKPEIRELMKATLESLKEAIKVAVVGKRMGDIGYAVQSYTESRGYGVVRELVGHGLGMELHEAPEVPNYGRRGNGMKLQEGLVLAIEPMINMGTKNVKQQSDGWTIVTADGLPSAHYEHNIVVRPNEAEVLSTFDLIEETILS